jgi:hypothetical protein
MSNAPMPFVPGQGNPPLSFPATTPTTPAQLGVMPTPVMPAAQQPEKPAKKEIPSTPNKVIGAKIIVQYKGENGEVYEASTVIDREEYKIQNYSLAVEEKHEKKRDPETRDLIGFEDTGERILTLKVRYHVR